jgi:hypothetical protein
MARDLGAEAYLAKTILLDELLSTIAHFLSAQAA